MDRKFFTKTKTFAVTVCDIFYLLALLFFSFLFPNYSIVNIYLVITV